MNFKLLATFAYCFAAIAAPDSSQLVGRWQKAAVQKHPALATAGSLLNQRFLAIIAEKRKAEPAFFEKPDWPMRAADAAAEALKAEEEAARAKGVFEGVQFGDNEETIVKKLGASKLLTSRATGNRIALNSRFRWVMGESKFDIEFEMVKDGLVAIVFAPLAEDLSELDNFVRQDWEKLRAAATGLFGQPSKSVGFPIVQKLVQSATTVTDAWERPGMHVKLGIAQDAGKAAATLRISRE